MKPLQLVTWTLFSQSFCFGWLIVLMSCSRLQSFRTCMQSPCAWANSVALTFFVHFSGSLSCMKAALWNSLSNSNPNTETPITALWKRFLLIIYLSLSFGLCISTVLALLQVAGTGNAVPGKEVPTGRSGVGKRWGHLHRAAAWSPAWLHTSCMCSLPGCGIRGARWPC